MWRALAVVAALLAAPALAGAAKDPAYCTEEGILEVLAVRDKDPLDGVFQINCADLTGNGTKDAVFTLDSGGSAGPVKWGVLSEDANLVLLRNGYSVTVDAVNSRRFDVQSPFYKKDDPNCCPSSFSFTKYVFKQGRFVKSGTKKYKTGKKRFFTGILNSGEGR